MANVKFNSELADRIIRAITDGASQDAAAQKVGIAAESLSIWKKKFPAFGAAVQQAHGRAKVSAEHSLFRLAAKGNVNALIFWLKNRHPSEWRDVQRREVAVNRTFEDLIAELETPATAEQSKEADHVKRTI
jgi:hypothetical protein